jgi:hypothetical protein
MMSLDFVPPVDPGFGDPTFGDPGIPEAFSAFFALFAVIVVLGIGFSIYVGIRKYRIIKVAGHDPFTVDAALAAKVLNSDVLRPGAAADSAAPVKSLEQRLAEIDSLHESGVISAEERAAARAAILAS